MGSQVHRTQGMELKAGCLGHGRMEPKAGCLGRRRMEPEAGRLIVDDLMNQDMTGGTYDERRNQRLVYGRN